MSVFFNAIIRRRLGVAALILLAGCGDDNNGGTGPTPAAQPPQITCPADVTVKGVTGSAQTVAFPDPTVANGTAPVTSSCNKTSGSSFPLGTTPVSCTATDAQQRASTCSFNVTLSGFSLGASKFGTFGDSLTEGEVGRPNVIDTPNAYPTKLQILFDQTYPGQGITVINRGHGGDTVETTIAAIRKFVPGDKPDAVLLLTGFNNLTQTCPTGSSASQTCRNAIDGVAAGILECIRKARESSPAVRYVFVSTLTPPGATGSQRIDGNAIVQVNNRIKQVIAQERATLTDSYVAFQGHEAEYVNVDGLHLKPAGYQALADTFFAVIQATVPQTPLLRAR